MEYRRNAINVTEKYALLEQLIKESTAAIEYFVNHQGPGTRALYAKSIVYLCLVKQKDPQGVCYGLRWAKYKIADETGRRTWYSGWKVGKLPPSVVKKIDTPENQAWVRFLDRQANKLVSVRKDLTTKKKRILGTLQVITDAYRDRVDEIMEETEAAQQERTQAASQ